MAMFNLAVRGSRRELVGTAALAVVGLTIAPLIYPGSGGYLRRSSSGSCSWWW